MTKLELMDLGSTRNRRRKGRSSILAGTFVLLALFLMVNVFTRPMAAYGALWPDFFVKSVDTEGQKSVRVTVGYQKGEGIFVQTLEETPVKVKVDGATVITRAVMPRLDDILKDAGVELGQKDHAVARVSSVSGKLPEIDVIRVYTRIVTEEEAIPYSEKRVPDQNLASGTTRVQQSGQEGLRLKKFEVTTENGDVVEKKQLGSEVTREPVTQVTAYGTKNAVGSVAARGVSLQGRKSLDVVATAYTHTGNPTASGVMPYVGGVAVDPKVIPLDTNLYVEGYGYAKAVDTGGLIKGNRVDIFLDTVKECYAWGKRSVKVYILE